MATFHFQIRTETHVRLAETAELASLDEARLEAARRVGELLTAHAGLLWTDEDWQMDVTNQDGLILFVIHINAMRTAATGSSAPAK